MFSPSDPTIGLISISMLIWYVCIFFIPFAVIGIGKKVQNINTNLEIIITLQLKQIPDNELTKSQLMKKYSVTGPINGPYVFDNRYFSELDSAISASKET